MRGLASLTRIEAKVLFLRDPVVLLVALAVPIGILLVFGLPGFARDPAPELGGRRPIDTILPSVALAVSVGVLAISALPGYLATYREKGILRRLATTPARPALLLVAQVVVNLAMALVALALTLGIGAAWLGMAMPASVGWFALAFALGTAALFAVGLVIAAVAPSARAANAIGMLAFFPSLAASGRTDPVTVPQTDARLDRLEQRLERAIRVAPYGVLAIATVLAAIADGLGEGRPTAGRRRWPWSG
jgi:ABC-2 type transport system permease protein